MAQRQERVQPVSDWTEVLTPDELRGITGVTQFAAQKTWLDRNGWPYVTATPGRPVVGC